MQAKPNRLKLAGLTFIGYIVRAILALRYRLRVEGLDKVIEEQGKKPGGIFFLPNHTAEIDPVMLMAILWPKFKPRPLIVEHFYYLKGFHFFIRNVGALPLPTMDTLVNTWKAKRIDKMMHFISEERKKEDNFLIYPSGRLKHDGSEVIGGASFVHSLLQLDPEAKVVLVRMTGLWGSTFSRAITNKSPDFNKALLQGLKIILQNLFFFTPRREVKIEFSCAPADLPIKAQRLDFNRYLENWYNRYPQPGPEPISLVSFAFWKKKLPTLPDDKEKKGALQEVAVPPELEKEIFNELAKIARTPVQNLKRETNLSADLGLDSLDMTELYLALDERFHIGNLAPGQIQTVDDMLRMAAGAKAGLHEEEEGKPEFVWPQETQRPGPVAPLGETLAASFLLMCDRMGKAGACMDALSGPMSYKTVKTAALILAAKIRDMPGDKIGIMLPSANAAYLVILAVLLANKTPVMLNWTAGTRSLEHSAKLTDLKSVISSMRFLGKRELGDFGFVDDLITLIEDIRFSLTLREKIKGALLARKKAHALLKKLRLDKISKDDCAAILFTSGTESLPKGVPLSHENLLSNQAAAVALVDLKAEDLLYGVLPPFHSFGFSVTGLLPFLTGLKIAFAPDPTDSHGMAADIRRWQPTFFCCAPSFIKALFRADKPEAFASIRLFVCGAEKAPQELFDYVQKLGPGHEMLEGYGVTECSPIVTFTPPNKPRKGVGQPISGVQVCVIDPESKQKLGNKQEGEVCVFGPNVFHGYLGDRPPPFVDIDGKKWYRTGDRGSIDEEGNLHLSGRFSRFIKIGAEMIGLGGLEEDLIHMAKDKHWTEVKEEGPPLAVAVKEKESEKPLLILVTTFDINKDVVNEALKEKGYGPLVRIADVKKVDQIPLTGTGKTHYRLLDEMMNK